MSLTTGGYLDQLRVRLPAGITVRNLSIGDQDSVMGYVRLLQHRESLSHGDILIWEYALLDILLNGFFGLEDALFAMTSAWRLARKASVRLIVVMVTPRNDLRAESAIEIAIRRAIDAAGLACLSFRDLLVAEGVEDAAAHYSDDRHPKNASPAVAALVDRLLKLINAPLQATVTEDEGLERWTWCNARDLARSGVGELVTWSNSLLSVEALRLAPDNIRMILPGEAVRLAVVSTREAGSLWCGHALCNPASLRMPAHIGLPFMLRLTRLPCARGSYQTIEAAPPHAFANGAWADYGQIRTEESQTVDVFGVLASSKAIG